MISFDFDQPGIAVFDSGARVFIYPGEHEIGGCFAGVLLNPTERELQMNAHVSCLWDRSKVARIDPTPSSDSHRGRVG